MAVFGGALVMKYLWRHLVASALYFSFRKAEGSSEIESAEQETPSLSSGRKLVLHLEKSSSSVSLELKWACKSSGDLLDYRLWLGRTNESGFWEAKSKTDEVVCRETENWGIATTISGLWENDGQWGFGDLGGGSYHANLTTSVSDLNNYLNHFFMFSWMSDCVFLLNAVQWWAWPWHSPA